jgi:hypothetical protein
MSSTAVRQFGDGPLSRAAALVYTLLVVEILVLVGTAPGLAVLLLLDPDASNVPLAAACLLPAGPALSAALYAVRHRRLDLTDLHPAAAYWRGYRLNAVGALRIWVPWLAWLAIVGITLTHLDAAGIPRWWAVLLGLLAAVATLWVTNALVITSLFAFRARDVARLAAYFLARTPKVTLANACLLVVAVAVTAVASEIVLALAASLLTAMLLRNCRPMIDQVRREFTA